MNIGICIGLAAALSINFVPIAWAQSAATKSQPDGAALTARLKAVRADTAQTEASIKLGVKTAQFCANCHGPNGNSVTPETPHLAGQNPAYLLEQIAQFSDGRRKHEFMQGLMRALSVDEKVGAALHFSHQAVTPVAGVNPAHASKGKAYYAKSCAACHGEAGLGSETLARVAGQQSSYVTRTLKRYRDGSAARLDPQMGAVAKAMSDDDIQAVAAYLSGMR